MTSNEDLLCDNKINIKKIKENDGYSKINRQMKRIFGFSLRDISSYENFVKFMYRPTDPSSLGIIRFLYGFLMLIDILEERAGSEIDLRWGDPNDCHFPLIPFIRPMPLPYMGLIYGIMWLGALGIMLGYKFHRSALIYSITYWYIFLIDKSFWNNHSYLFGICSLLFLGTCANYYFSIDGLLNEKIHDAHVPFWNYFVLKFQFFLLYFLAGLKKTDYEWLEGYGLTNISKHWVFNPFKFFLTTDQTDFLIVHWFGFIFDLTVGFWMLFDQTRPYAMIFCILFHLMNSRLFAIGMFPYVCLATMPLFCSNDWPRKIIYNIKKYIYDEKSIEISKPKFSTACIYDRKMIENLKINEENGENEIELETNIKWKHKFVVGLMLTHFSIQFFLPYSHFITKGYNNWTNGLYGYSWDMMVHTWDTTLVVVKVIDNNNKKEHFLDSEAWTQNKRWTQHGDMVYQYAQCIQHNLINQYRIDSGKYPNVESRNSLLTSENISIYVDIWTSLNGRFPQRLFNPRVDLLKMEWHPFKPMTWIMPLLTEFDSWRKNITKLRNHIYSWSNYSDVIFAADFPGFYLDNYIPFDIKNITLTVLEGEIFFERELNKYKSVGQRIKRGESLRIKSGFHKVHTISSTPSAYMYTFINKTRMITNFTDRPPHPTAIPVDDYSYNRKSPFPLLEDVDVHLNSFGQMFQVIGNSLLNIFYGVPMVRRVKIYE